KWSRGGHFTFEVPESFLAIAANATAAPSEAPASTPVTTSPATSPRVTASINLVAFILVSATRKGSWRAWQSLAPDERRHFLDWAKKELAALIKIGWLLTAEQYESPSETSGEDAE
ncbi:MAG TPA: hypothetical protein VMU78_06530, partial [Methylocella sp.]|nr:hypothetical protein [Methylocella sp.]